jgi:UTP--glucose-1-phosphate uridylyltransferase
MVRKAVIPAAGFGTRFLPASKSSPKEMLPIVDKPVIQYVVEEAVESGITDILMIIGKGKRAIEEHFDRSFELENELSAKGKSEELETIKKISSMANVHFVWQKELNGLGDAISYARHHVGNEPFVVLLGDTIVKSPDGPVTSQMMDVYDQHQETVIALQEVSPDKVNRYGIMSGKEISDRIYHIDDLIEKPEVGKAPSNLAVAGRYILTPDIFDYIEKTPRGINNELQLTDAMRMQIAARTAYGLKFSGRRYDIGNKLDFIKTNLLFGLEREDLKDDLQAFVKSIAADIE